MARQAREAATGASARARFIWVSPYKVRSVASLVRGKHIDEARRVLAFTPNDAARHLEKVLESAVANAEHNSQIPQEELVIRDAWADEGPTYKRWQPRARGAAYIIRKRTSHINVVVERVEREAPPPRRPEKRRGRAETRERPRVTTAPSGEKEVSEEKPPRRPRRRAKTKPEPAKATADKPAKATAAKPRRKTTRKSDTAKSKAEVTGAEAPGEAKRMKRRRGPEIPKGGGGED